MKTAPLVLVITVLAVALLFRPAVAEEPKEVPIPEGTGVFYKSPFGFVALRTAPPVQAKAKGGFLTPARSRLQFAGVRSATQIREARPVFYVKQMGWDERTCALIRLVNGKETRDLPISTRSFTAKEEYLVPVATKVLAMNPGPMQYPIFTITPQQDLTPGEYLIAFNPSAAMAYEFGVSASAASPDRP